MTVSNHIITGAMIAITIDKPVLAIPLAFASHFLIDMLPHFGYPRAGYGEYFQHKLARSVLALDFVTVLTLLIVSWPQAWLVYVAGFVAVSPDFAWPYRYYFFEKRGLAKPGEGNRFNTWHNKIQWCERPWGILFEIAWFCLMLTIILKVT